MKHSIRLTCPEGAHSYLSHRGKTSFAPAAARKHLAQWLAANPGGIARIENQFGEPAPSAANLEARARRLYALRLTDPRAPQYALADSLMERARMINA